MSKTMNNLSKNSDVDIISTRDLDQNPAAVYLAGLTPAGRRSQAQALKMVAGIMSKNRADLFSFPWASLRFQHTVAIRAKLIGCYKPATVNRILCAVRGVLKNAWRLGQIGIEDYQRAVDISSVSGETILVGRELSSDEIAALMSTCLEDSSPSGVRDGAIIALMYACGLRREEMVALEFSNYDQREGSLKVLGKRSKERIVWLTNGVKDAMDDWIQIRNTKPGPLFLAINKAGKIREGRMSNQTIYNLFIKRGKTAGIKDFSPHDMRRTFVSDLLDAGVDISTVAKMVGHGSVNTTARYDRRSEEIKRKAAALLNIPYQKRV
jgi:site-specific recombinase XerD